MGCYFWYNWCKLLYYRHQLGHPTLFACFSQYLWSALENFLSSSNASAQECSNGLSSLWKGEHSVYKGFCDEGRSHPFWQSKGLAFLQSFMLLMCSQKKEVHSLKFWKLKPCVRHENVSAIEEWKTHATKDLCWLRCFQPHHYPVFIWQILLYSIKKLFLCQVNLLPPRSD